MRYSADTGFLLALYGKDPKAGQVLRGLASGKDWHIISYICSAEFIKKLYQQGQPENKIKSFLERLKNMETCKFVGPEDHNAKEAANISFSYGITLVNAFVAATAIAVSCQILLSRDSDFQPLVNRKLLNVRSW